MNDQANDGSLTTTAANPFGQEYYASHCGPYKYDRSEPFWGVFFGNIADMLIRSFRPTRVFDAGCALGFLVESFWDRGVEAWGRDISEFGISQVRSDIRDFCHVGSIAEPISSKFDLITCIEVVEHMPELLAKQAIEVITSSTDRVLFSSSPSDLEEPTHINVRPTIYWIRLFAAQGFVPLLSYDATFVISHCLIFERASEPPSEEIILGCAEIVRLRIEQSKRDQIIHHLRISVANTQGELATTQAGLATTQAELATTQAGLATSQAELATTRAIVEQYRQLREDDNDQLRKLATVVRQQVPLVRFQAALRHPLSSERRKAYRENRLHGLNL